MRNEIFPEMIKTRVIISFVHGVYMCTNEDKF